MQDHHFVVIVVVEKLEFVYEKVYFILLLLPSINIFKDIYNRYINVSLFLNVISLSFLDKEDDVINLLFSFVVVWLFGSYTFNTIENYFKC